MDDGSFRTNLENFNFTRDRLDSFFLSVIGGNPEYKELFSVIQKILILSHGNAPGESGFSLNKQFSVENLREDSLIALRLISDHIHACNGPSNVKIAEEVLDFARSARVRYREASDKGKVAGRRTKQKEELKGKAKEEFEDLQAKRVALRQRIEAEDKLLKEQMKDVRKAID